jgi:hypothetical protein
VINLLSAEFSIFFPFSFVFPVNASSHVFRKSTWICLSEMGESKHLALTILIVVCFLMGNSPASEFYIPTFREHCLFHLHTYPPMKMEQTECSETSGYKIQAPGNYPEESIRHSAHGESLKSRICCDYTNPFHK